MAQANPFETAGQRFAGGLLGRGVRTLLGGGDLSSLFSPASLAGSAAGVGFGMAGNALLDSAWGNRGVGSRIGQGLGGLAGSALGPAGSLLGSVFGAGIGSLFGPGESVGPHGQASFGRTPSGGLGLLGTSGDNGINPQELASALRGPVSGINAGLLASGSTISDMPMTRLLMARLTSPTLQFGGDDNSAYLHPFFGPQSLASGLVRRGYVQGNPDRFLSLFGGMEPEHAMMQGEGWLPVSGLGSHAYGRDLVTAPGGYQAIEIGSNDRNARQRAETASPGALNYALDNGRQAFRRRDEYGNEYWQYEG